ncbi:hypothetical protein BH10PSE12_BH10PSE12_18920 [soil metagenome]
MGNVVPFPAVSLADVIIIEAFDGDIFTVTHDQPSKRSPRLKGFEIDMRGRIWRGDFPSYFAALGLAQAMAEHFGIDVVDHTDGGGSLPPSTGDAA